MRLDPEVTNRVGSAKTSKLGFAPVQNQNSKYGDLEIPYKEDHLLAIKFSELRFLIK